MESHLLFLVILVITVFQINGLYVPTVVESNDDDGGNTVKDVQRAVCNITSRNLTATANATFTRELKGVCTKTDLNSRMDKLEDKILQQIADVRAILELNGFKIPDSLTVKSEIIPDTQRTLRNDFENNFMLNEKFRSEEISAYNDSVNYSNQQDVYTYYWKIDQIHEILSRNDVYTSSPEFTVLGHSLRLRFYSNYLERGIYAIQLRPLNKGFLKKHELFILNQYSNNAIASGMLYSSAKDSSMFVNSMDGLKEEGYICKDAIIIKLQIYLNS